MRAIKLLTGILTGVSVFSPIACFAKEGPNFETDPQKIKLMEVEQKVRSFIHTRPQEYYLFTRFVSFPEDYAQFITEAHEFKPLSDELIDVMELDKTILPKEADYDFSLNVLENNVRRTKFNLTIKFTLKGLPDVYGTTRQWIYVDSKETQSEYVLQNIWKYWTPFKTRNMTAEEYNKYYNGGSYRVLTQTIAEELGLNWEKLNSMLVKVPGIKVEFTLGTVNYMRGTWCLFTLNEKQLNEVVIG